MVAGIIVALVVLLALFLLANAIRIVKEYERVVIFRLGRLQGQRGPGLVFIIPMIERAVRVDQRVVAHSVPDQEIITHDNVTARVAAVAYFRVIDPIKSVVAVQEYFTATSQIAQTTLRSVLGKAELDQLLSERDQLNEILRKIIDDQVEPWGVQVSLVEIKQVELPSQMQRAMARQAEAERERRAKVINAEGEAQAAVRLTEAAEVMGAEPIAFQLRYLQTLLEVGSENHSTAFFPIPIELFKPFIKEEGKVNALTEKRKNKIKEREQTDNVPSLFHGSP